MYPLFLLPLLLLLLLLLLLHHHVIISYHLLSSLLLFLIFVSVCFRWWSLGRIALMLRSQTTLWSWLSFQKIKLIPRMALRVSCLWKKKKTTLLSCELIFHPSISVYIFFLRAYTEFIFGFNSFLSLGNWIYYFYQLFYLFTLQMLPPLLGPFFTSSSPHPTSLLLLKWCPPYSYLILLVSPFPGASTFYRIKWTFNRWSHTRLSSATCVLGATDQSCIL